jgi:6-pyruvoyltetrahydropterin/6-carboxytetrahydropterin synthase
LFSVYICGDMVYITRRERFTAAHRLFDPKLNDAQNTEIFGGCANPNWHGHNYEMFVTVKGEVSPELGWVMNLKTLSDILKEKVTSKMDHKNLNVDVDFLKGIMTSTENLAIAIWNEIDGEIRKHGAELHCIKIRETENNYVEFYGGK